MKKSSLFALLLAAGFAAAPDVSRAELLLYYNFESATATNGAAIDNLVGLDGTLRFGTAGGTVSLTPGGTVSGGNLGLSLLLTPAADGNGNIEAPHINTNFSATALSITSGTAYTAMAWVKFASISGDNMIFGQDNTAAEGVLHNGSRDGRYHSGHWGDDQQSGEGVTTGTTNWHHVAYTNDAAGTQQIFVDGVQVASGATGTAGGMNNALNVLIGTSENGGSFSGQLDEIKIYNETLSASQIQAASVVIPEPGSVAILALGAGALGLLRRRRQA